MKHINKIISLGFAAITLASCGGGSQNQGGNSDSTATTEITPSEPSDYQPIPPSTINVDPSVYSDDSQFFYSEQRLPEKIDYNMNLDNLSYSNSISIRHIRMRCTVFGLEIPTFACFSTIAHRGITNELKNSLIHTLNFGTMITKKLSNRFNSPPRSKSL